MPHLHSLSPALERRLAELADRLGLSRAELIERCVALGLEQLERPAAPAVPGAVLDTPPGNLDQRLRESGLGA